MVPCLVGGTSSVAGEGVRLPEVLSTDNAFGSVGAPESALWGGLGRVQIVLQTYF